MWGGGRGAHLCRGQRPHHRRAPCLPSPRALACHSAPPHGACLSERAGER